ncbi:MAG: hypothetical protein EB121_05235 [Alphaproteobacteria bacterium]|nr:hypothetical protein [Betaproteobacteria bacterium]NDG04737.1 hypothetical protein [Alphaproteobacteria bacterium]
MSIAAQALIRRVVETLQDTTSIRWPVAELVRYLNDGQREIIVHRPDAMVTNASVSLASGTKQSLPANGAKLIDVVRNSAGNKRAIRMCAREILDAQSPGWHNLSGVNEIVHFMFDPRDPKVFYVYPPAAVSGAAVDLVYSALPTDIAEPAAGTDFGAVTGNISVPDIYSNALQDYVLYRAYTKDSQYAGNEARAQARYAAFANALGIEIKATVAVAPSAAGNPNQQQT